MAVALIDMAAALFFFNDSCSHPFQWQLYYFLSMVAVLVEMTAALIPFNDSCTHRYGSWVNPHWKLWQLGIKRRCRRNTAVNNSCWTIKIQFQETVSCHKQLFVEVTNWKFFSLIFRVFYNNLITTDNNIFQLNLVRYNNWCSKYSLYNLRQFEISFFSIICNKLVYLTFYFTNFTFICIFIYLPGVISL